MHTPMFFRTVARSVLISFPYTKMVPAEAPNSPVNIELEKKKQEIRYRPSTETTLMVNLSHLLKKYMMYLFREGKLR